jgi:hypothetical protein
VCASRGSSSRLFEIRLGASSLGVAGNGGRYCRSEGVRRIAYSAAKERLAL